MLGLVQKLSDSARISAGFNGDMYWKSPGPKALQWIIGMFYHTVIHMGNDWHCNSIFTIMVWWFLPLITLDMLLK